MSKRGEAPQVSAGSMADIAFLLLIFFLVTTSIETDVGLERRLARIEKDSVIVDIHERNILPVLIDENGSLLVEGELIELKDLRAITVAFLDNGGVISTCTYCEGARDERSSDNPTKAVVSLMSNRETTYGAYVAVQNELVGAYNDLRNREAQKLFKTDFTSMETLYKDPQTSLEMKDMLKTNIRIVQDLYPMKLSEAKRN